MPQEELRELGEAAKAKAWGEFLVELTDVFCLASNLNSGLSTQMLSAALICFRMFSKSLSEEQFETCGGGGVSGRFPKTRGDSKIAQT